MGTPLRTASAVFATLGYAAYRRWQLRWGATPDEVGRALPGDEVVRRPQFSATRAITIDAAAASVWPWIVQMGGYTRAGWYSLDRIDNGGRPSADRIVPELQDLAVGDVMPTAPDGSGFRVEAVAPGRSLVLAIRTADAVVSAAFVLDEPVPGQTRLLTRLRFRVVRPSARALLWAAAMDAGDFVMFRGMLLGIRARAERHARRRPGASEPVDLAPGRPLTFDLAVVIRCAPGEAFELLAHKERYAVYPGSPVSVLERLTPGATRRGTRWVEVVPILPGLRLTVRSQAERVDPGAELVERFASRAFTGLLAYSFEPADHGTRLRQRETLELRCPLRVLARPVDRALRPRLLGRLAGIRDRLESGDQTSAAGR